MKEMEGEEEDESEMKKPKGLNQKSFEVKQKKKFNL